MQFQSSFYSVCFFSIHGVYPYGRTIARKKLRFVLLDSSNIHVFKNHTFNSCILMSFSVDLTLLLRYMNLSTNFREPSFRDISALNSDLYIIGYMLPIPFLYPFCSSGNNLWHFSEQYISSLICAVRIFHIIGRHVIGLWLMRMVLFGVYFWIRIVFA